MKILNLYLILFKLISESDNCNNNGDNNNIMIPILLITIIINIIVMITMLIAITRMRILIIVIMIIFVIKHIKQRKTIICSVNPDWYHHYNPYEGPAHIVCKIRVQNNICSFSLIIKICPK